MTENEKLRALLAEAREFLVPMFHDGCEEGGCDACRARGLDQRIDAALAETVAGCAEYARWEEYDEQFQRTVNDVAQRERDEARAEVERLAREHEKAREEIKSLNEVNDFLNRQIDRRAAQAARKAERERDEARSVLSALCSEFEGAVAHADWRAAGSPGMSVPFTGDFASATQLPSVVGRMRWWAREMRRVIGEKKP